MPGLALAERGKGRTVSIEVQSVLVQMISGLHSVLRLLYFAQLL